MTYPVGTNTLSSNNDWLEIHCAGTFAGNGSTKVVKAYFGAGLLLNPSSGGAVITGGGSWELTVRIIRTSSTSQVYTSTWQSNNSAVTSWVTTSSTAEDLLTAPVVFKVTGSATSDNDIVQTLELVEYHHAQ